MKLPRHWSWVQEYSKDDLKGDLSGGLAVGVMLIPHAMAVALIAGLPPIMGLYAAVGALLVYVFLATSRRLTVGPVALDSLLVLAILSGIAVEGSAEYIALAMMLAVLVGMVQVVMGVMRMGFLVNMLSRPVLQGFVTGAPIIIGVSQLKHLLKIELPQSQRVWEVLAGVPGQLSDVHWATVAVGLAAIVLQVSVKKLRPKWPNLLIMVGVMTTASWLLGFEKRGILVVGEVPSGLPSPSLPVFEMEMVWTLLPSAVAIALIGYMEGISIAKVYAERYQQKLGENQELVAMGLANMGAGVMHGYPIGGSFARSAVNDQAGSRTPLANVFAASVVVVTLMFLSGLFYHLPKAVLASVVMVAVAKLINFGEMRRIFQVKPVDGYLALVTFGATLALGALWGMGIGIMASFFPIVLRLSRPRMVELGEMPDGREYRDLGRHDGAKRLPGVLILRVDASFCFLNAGYLRQRIVDAILGTELHTVVLDMSSINDLDATAFEQLERVIKLLQEKEVRLYLAGAKGPLRDTLEGGGLVALLGKERMFLNPADAITHLRRTTTLLDPLTQGAGI